MIPVFRPKLNKAEILSELEQIFDSGWIGLGPKTAEFEQRFAEYIGVKYAVGVSSCTAALHLANHVLDPLEVIVPSMTFASTALAPLYCRAKPVFADIEEDTLCIDPEDIERKITPKTKIITAVHYGGHACRMDEIMAIADRRGLYVIEDVAHGCGGKYKDAMLGSIGTMGCFSFHAVKNLPTGDGGMITTNDEQLYKRLQKLRWLGIDKGTWSRTGAGYSWQYSIDELGFKYHMNDITAVIGLAQLKLLNKHNVIRRGIAKRYDEAFSKISWITCPPEKEYAHSARHNYVIQIPFRDRLNEYLRNRGISTGVHYEPVHHHRVFGEQAYLPVTERVWTKLLSLPMFPGMTGHDFNRITHEIIEFREEL